MNDSEHNLFGDVDFAAVIRQFLQQVKTGDLKTKGRYPKRLGEFGFKVSFGMGTPSGIPWIAILGEGQKVSKGIYPVFLYYKDYDHLILAYGVSETEKPPQGWGEVVEEKQRIATQMKDLGFAADRYGESYVAAQYPNVSQQARSPNFAEQAKADVLSLLQDYRERLRSLQAQKASEQRPFEPEEENEQGSEPQAAVVPLNQILFGPPGTGKTYATIDHALGVLDPEFVAKNFGANEATRQHFKRRFDELVKEGRIRFVTFHQSFSYEDFVEGLRADSEGESGQIEYRVEPGVFRQLCDDARTRGGSVGNDIRDNPRIWKISINGTGASATKNYCLEHGEARIGWGEAGDLRNSPELNTYYQSLGSGDRGTLSYFAEQIVVGDILLCIHSADMIGSIGVVTGDYRYEKKVPSGVIGDYQHVRSVRWIYRDINLSILPLNDGRQFTLKTVYAMDRFSWADLLGYLQLQGGQPIKSVSAVATEPKPYMLIIDEINRGNVSRIFGELITLIEPSKREGAEEALSVKLPYSKKLFSVPENVYLLGTMNTADRSLAGLDIALRRRFTFCEMPPRPDLLDDLMVEEAIDVGRLLRIMNQRIEVLLGRDHCLGHAYFMPLKSEPTLERMALIFRSQILPLLQEYFFENWQRIQWVLNDHRKAEPDRFVIKQSNNMQALFGENVELGISGETWRLNDGAFERLEAYLGVIDQKKVNLSSTIKPEVIYEKAPAG